MACKRASNLLLLAAVWAVSLFPVFVQSADVPASSSPAPSATEATGSSLILPLPSSMPLVDYERKLYRWLIDRSYADITWADTSWADTSWTDISWAVDKRVRDTGPFINGLYYGTHPAVRIYYSPEVMRWLQNDRQDGIDDGGMIVRRCSCLPRPFYQELEKADPTGYEELLEGLVTGWTVMVKDSEGSKDGWFWANLNAPGTTFLGNSQTDTETIDANVDDYSHILTSGFGLYTCMRCHASAEKEFTFPSTENIKGFPGAPLQYHIDNSWRSTAHMGGLLARIPEHRRGAVRKLFELAEEQLPYTEQVYQYIAQHGPLSPSDAAVSAPPLKRPKADFIAAFSEFMAPDDSTRLRYPPVQAQDVRAIPSQWSDHVFPGAGGRDSTNTAADEFITSDTCIACHGGLGGSPSPVTMFVKTGPTYGDSFSVAPYGEWRWSPMGLAGRDPIFHAQLESEMIILAKNANDLSFAGSTTDVNDPIDSTFTLAGTQKALINTCLSCHGAMGQRQLAIDGAAGRTLANGDSLNTDFNPGYFYLTEALTQNELDHPPAAPAGEPNPSFSYPEPGQRGQRPLRRHRPVSDGKCTRHYAEV